MNKEISYFKKALIMLMAVMMVFTMMPSMAWADDITQKPTWLAGATFTVKGPNQTDYTVAEFDPAKTEYTVDIASTANSRTFTLTPTAAAVEAGVYFQFLLDDAPVISTLGNVVAPQQFTSTDTVKATKYTFDLAKVPIGTTHVVKLLVGPLADGATDLSEADCNVYRFTVNRTVGISDLVVKDSDGNTATLTPAFHVQENRFETKVSGSTIKIKTQWVNPTKVYVGNSTEAANSGTSNFAWTDVNLAEYTAEGSDTAIIPIRVKYESDGIKSEREVQLSVKWTNSQEDDTIVIESQSQDVVCNKGEDVELFVKVKPDSDGGTISYQWYLLYSYSKPDKVWESGILEDQTNDTIKAVTNEAEDRLWYCCKITKKTSDGREYSIYSELIHVVVNLNYVNKPVIQYQPGSIVLKNYAEFDLGTYKTEYYEREQCDPIYTRLNAAERGTTFSFSWFYNTDNSTSNGIEIPASFYKSSNGCYGYKLNKAFEEGTYYVYCIIRATDDKNADNYAETVSETCKVVFKSIDTADFKGNGTEADPFLLKSQEDLVKLQKNVNEKGISYAGKFFKIANDITLPQDWKPIGCTKDGSRDINKGLNLNAFSGTIDGKISDGQNATITVPAGGLPLLGYVKEATVKNLNIYGKQIAGYGLVNNFEGVGLEGTAITIDGVRLKEGSQTLKSGLIGANITTNQYAGNSVKYVAVVRNCVIEEGVVIGYTGNERQIGSIAGRFQGTIENCESYATVQGKDYVGGIVGTMDNAVEKCIVKMSKFHGTVTASGNYAGGIVGGGYCNDDSAPNACRPTIMACVVDGKIQGADCVGGITGGDAHVAQTWDNVAHSVIANSFSGTVKATDGKYVGGIIGYYNSLNRYDNIKGNFYTKNCGAQDGIGFVKYIDTNCSKPTLKNGTVAFNTEKSTNNCPDVYITSETPARKISWKAQHNRTDDPLGADKGKLAKAVDTIPTDAFCYELVIDGTPTTEYYEGQELNFSNVTFTAKWTDGTETHPTFGTGEDQVHASGYNKNSHSVQTVILSYGYAQYELQVAVLKNPSTTDPAKNTLTVKFTLLGDSKHDEPTNEGGPHGLATGGLTEWTSGTYEVGLNATVWNLMQLVQQRNSNIVFNARGSKYGAYIYSVKYKGTELAEFDNGRDSGWMYTVNGSHPEVGVGSYFLSDGDNVIFHYTDDYTKEEGSDKWNTPGAIEEVKEVTTDTKTGITTAPTDVKVSEKTNADGTKTKVADVKVSADNQKEILKQAKASKSKEIILNVSGKSVGDATKADVTLDKSFIDSIVKDTNAKLTIKTPFGDKTYTQDELKAMSEAATGSTVTVAIEKAAEEPTDDAAAKIEKAKSIVKDMKLVARSSKTAKKNIKAVLKSDAKVKASIKELKDLGFTVKHRFYRSTKKAASYRSTVTKKTASYTNTSGKKGTKYFYKVQVRVYDENGKLVAKTALKQCKYASRTWSKAR